MEDGAGNLPIPPALTRNRTHPLRDTQMELAPRETDDKKRTRCPIILAQRFFPLNVGVSASELVTAGILSQTWPLSGRSPVG